MNKKTRDSLILVSAALGATAGIDFFVAFSGGEPLLLGSVGLQFDHLWSVIGLLCMLALAFISIRRPTRLSSCLLLSIIVAMIWTLSASNNVMSERYAWHVAKCLAMNCEDRIDLGGMAVDHVQFGDPNSVLKLEVAHPAFRRFDFVWESPGRGPIRLSVLLDDERPAVLVWKAADQASIAPDAQDPAR